MRVPSTLRVRARAPPRAGRPSSQTSWPQLFYAPAVLKPARAGRRPAAAHCPGCRAAAHASTAAALAVTPLAAARCGRYYIITTEKKLPSQW